MAQETGGDNTLELMTDILETNHHTPSTLPLHSFLTPARPIKITPEEIITRKIFDYLGGRRWGYARRAREKLLNLTTGRGLSTAPVFLLECLSDIFEGKVERAVSAYRKASHQEHKDNHVLDFYIVREFLTYLGADRLETPPPAITDQELARARWFFSPIASVLYRSRQETSNVVINELGQLADALINEPGTTRFTAVILRAIQGNRLIERGEYAWAQRVLTYTQKRADRLMSFNTALTDGIQRDLAIAHNGLAHLSYQ